jgi:competence protein ComEA
VSSAGLIYLRDSTVQRQGKNYRHMRHEQDNSESPSAEEPKSLWIKRSQQQSLLFLVSSCLMLLLSYWFYLGGHRGRLIEIDRAEPLTAKYEVDINRADWPEMIQLPGLGETLARRIVADRQEHGPFRDVDELDRVDGIGQRTLERIRPYLMPIPKDSDWAGLELESSKRVQ